MSATGDAAHLPIARVLWLHAVCEDCGRRFSMDRHAVAREQIRRGLATPEDLGSYLRCLLCVERGGTGRNISIRIRFAGERGVEGGRSRSDLPMPSGRVAWSRAAVFGEDRSSPFPNLPPSRFLRQ